MSLTQFSYYFRRFLPFIILGFLLLLVLVYTFKVFFLYLGTQSPQTVYTNPAFGKITRPKLTNAKSSGGFSYLLDTVEGEPTTATASANVFFLPQATTRFGYREKIYLIAKNLGFDTEIVTHHLNGKEAIFEDGTQSLTIDITNFNYNYEYRYATNEAFFQNTIIPEESDIEEKAIDFLKSVGRYPEELAKGKNHILYFNLDVANNRLYATERPKEANVVEVDFYRPDIPADPTAIPIVSPSYFNSPNHVVMVFNESSMKVLRAQVSFFEKSDTQVGVYPVKTGNIAWEEFKSGKGMIVSNDTEGSSITIKKMFLGYLDPDIYESYLEPVYVFLGDNNFVGYVPAVSNDFLTD